ncbi:sulfite exporter TauE/SafE family protein [Moraxella nasovis]|uniref:sulfite exporter TauE/SafE family protein n=1 Tax=Moraxella nasovis TaxID=2904121 RepID=UPI001F61A6F1|nr:sulfite exporter TauE/SafE family protein [Moraxella nasovis]UNU73798.1 sulfite exporter TauE/SafE family protein [Moraxella nasovis]
MYEQSIWTDLTLSIINLFTSALAGITGVGGGTILIGLMPMFLPAFAIVPIHGITQLSSNVSRIWFGRDEIDFTHLKPFVIGAFTGVIVFGVLVRFVQLDLVPLFIACYILLTQHSSRINQLLKGIENFYLIGFLQVGIGMFVGAPGPLHMPMLLKLYDDKSVAVTVGSMMMTVVHTLKLMVYVSMGFAFWQYWQLIGLMVAAAVFGSYLGVRLRHRLPMTWLKVAMPWILTVIAIKIIWDNAVKFGWFVWY